MAIKNADKLADNYKDACWPSVECSPRTDMGELVKMFL